jgi:SAM-dependent methyltransferase
VVGRAEAANRRWAEMLAQWAIPDHLVAEAAVTPYFFDPAVFVAAADQALARDEDTPSDADARAALPPGGTVLDVGVGAGAAGLRLAERAREVIGVDTSQDLLDAFGDRARRLGVAHRAVHGRWPEVAPLTPAADVVVCHHVFYNAPDLLAFASALGAHARARVVVELTAVHPMAWMRPYWEALHGLTQPERPTADDAVAVLAAMGVRPRVRRWWRRTQMIGECDDDMVARVARRLCLAADREEELRRVVATTPPPESREVVTLSWDVAR